MTLNQKFQLYQFQQTDKRSAKKGGMGGGDDEDEMNFISMVEYQSLENGVRKNHVQLLQELREFWTGVRNSKSKDELCVQLDRISELTNKTKNTYNTMIKRFPNSSNVLKLYARFTAIVLADRDYAKEIHENAKDNEFIQQQTAGNADNSEAGSEFGENLDRKSVGSSNNSDKSKAALMLKKKRELMEERLDAPISNFLRNANIFTLFFVLLMAASASLSYAQIFKTNDALQSQGFVSLLSRTTLHRFNLHFRRLSYFGFNNNTARWNVVMSELSEDLKLWNDKVIQLYKIGPGQTMTSIVRKWDNGKYSLATVNAYQSAGDIYSAVQKVNESATAIYATKNSFMTNPSIRLVLDNTDSLTEFYTSVRQAEIREHENFIVLLRTTLLCCKSSIAILAFIFSLIIPYMSYQAFRNRFVSTLLNLTNLIL